MRKSYEIVRICTTLHCFLLVLSSDRLPLSFLTMSQTLSQLATQRSRPEPSADTLAVYQGFPVAHHHMEEATYDQDALGVAKVVDWAASLALAPEVVHIDLRSPLRNSCLGGTEPWRQLQHRVPSVRFLHFLPSPATVEQLLRGMSTNMMGEPKDAHVQL